MQNHWISQKHIVLFFFLLHLPLFFWKAFTIFERWQGAPTCMNISRRWRAIGSLSMSFSISVYLAPLIVIPEGKKKSPSLPVVDITPSPNSWHWKNVSLNIVALVTSANSPTKMPFSPDKLLDSIFILGKDIIPLHFVQFPYFLAKAIRLAFKLNPIIRN